MKAEELNKAIKSMEEKLGKENIAMIQDDLGIIIAGNENTNKVIEQLNKESKEDKEKIETLILSNGNLFQQIGMEDKNDFNKQKENDEHKEKFSFRSAFDEKGNFK